jgi:hypothetical protein
MTKKNKKQIESLSTNEIGNCLVNISKSEYGLCIEFIHPTSRMTFQKGAKRNE